MRTCRWILLTLLLFAGGLTVHAEAPFSFESTPGQLPKVAVPQHYSIYLRPDLGKFTTSGSASIDLEVLKSTKEIVLNALDIEVTSASLTDQKHKAEIPLKHRANREKPLLTLKAADAIKPGKYRLNLTFNGQIGEQAQGLFYVKYSTPSGKKKIMLGTQMEPSDARRMFPCWDEPVYRATFELTVVVPENHKAYSNMPIEREKPLGDGLKEVKFARTPSMASYLVAFVSGEMEELHDESEGVQLRIVTTEGKKEQGRLALDAAKHLLAYYNDFFGIKYPLPKLDLIAIPGGFSGAMENWGAITYHESLLLFDPKTSSPHTKRTIYIVVAHEMSHQWFGDLVTTAWWDNLWLNEGFASWMEAKATDHFHPEWEIMLSAASDKSYVMNNDARSTTHPIQQPVNSESEADDAFDDITYQKGEAFLRMLEDYLGEGTFRKGVHRYLLAHAYSSATTADLWKMLEQVSGKPVQKIAPGWTEQPGVPIVKVKAECVNGKQFIALEQERFTVQDKNAKPLQWAIPVAFTNVACAGSSMHVLLKDKSTSIKFADCDGIVKANAGDMGYFRVLYAPALASQLEGRIAGLPAADRLNLLDDAWSMVEAGRVPAAHYLAVVKSLSRDQTYAIWDQILFTFALIDELEQGKPGRAPFQSYARNLLRPQFERLGWNAKRGDSDNDLLLRARIIGALGHYGDQHVIAQARGRFAEFLKRPESLPADLRVPVMGIVGRYSDKQTYEQLHQLARTAKGAEEQQLFYGAMAAALAPELVKATLEISLMDETTPQQATKLVAQVAAASEHQEAAWEFARQHMKELLAKVDSFERNLYVPSILSPFSDAARADELEAYVQANVSEDAMVKARETAEGIRLKATLKQRELSAIDEWVAGQQKNK